MSCNSCGHGFELFEAMADAPSRHHGRLCPVCHNEDAYQDYTRKTVPQTIVWKESVANLPKNCGAEKLRDGYRNRHVVRNPREWSELCKRNDWTDVSDSSGPPEEWVPRETSTGGGLGAVEPPAHMGSAGEGETHRFTYRGDE